MLLRLIPALSTLIVVALFMPAGVNAQPATPADCEKQALRSGNYGKDVIWLPTPDEVVHRMLTITETSSDDFVVDLGAGDGNIVITAAKEFGARALGIEYEPELVEYANCLARVENVADRVEIRRGDIFKEDFSQANVVTLYLLPQLNLCVRHRLLAMEPGTRVTSHAFSMNEWMPDKKTDVDSRIVYLWIIPARVGGRWDFREAGGDFRFNVNLNQVFQNIAGDAIVNDTNQPLVNPALMGDEIQFAFYDEKGGTHALTGTVRGREIKGVLNTPNGQIQVVGTAQGNLVAGEWAEMASDCGHYYTRR